MRKLEAYVDGLKIGTYSRVGTLHRMVNSLRKRQGWKRVYVFENERITYEFKSRMDIQIGKLNEEGTNGMGY